MDLISLYIHATAWALVVSLICIGLSLVFSIMALFNLSHASFYMLAVFLGYTVVDTTGSYLLAIVVVPIFLAAVGGVMERYVLRRLEGNIAAGVIATIGFLQFFEQSTLGIFGGQYIYMNAPVEMQYKIAGVSIDLYDILMIAVCLVLLYLLRLFLMKTRYGLSIRALADDRENAAAIGINVNRILILIFSLAMFLAAVGGILAGPIVGGFYLMDIDMLISACIITVVGGVGSVYGAIAASFLIVFTEYTAILFIDPLEARLISFGILIVVLLIQPEGLAGWLEAREA